MTGAVVFAVLPQADDIAPEVMAEVGSEVVAWDPNRAAWSCSCDYRRAHHKADPLCSHIVRTGQALPVVVACHLATALVRAGLGSATSKRVAPEPA